MRLNHLLVLAGLIVAPRLSLSQERGAAALGEAVLGMGTSARVLVIGAHPDDEDTQLIAWLTRGRHVETAYLSLTRGDGGQNLIGNELGEALGVLRTEELLAARRIDGGRQYFARAYDFGFSKTAEETLKHWPRDSLLQDVVTVVRAFRPHVIIAMFTGTPRDGHGHHQVSGILAREAFDAAADTVRFPRARTSGLGAWTPLKFYRGPYGSERATASLVFNVGEYSALLGRSFAEIAAESRSQHLSQGFGQLQLRGARLDHVKLEVTRTGANVDTREQGLFDGIDTSWSRFRRGALGRGIATSLDSMFAARDSVLRDLSLRDPRSIVGPLSRFVRIAGEVRERIGCPNDPVPRCGGGVGDTSDLANSLNVALERSQRALLLAAGAEVEAFAERATVAAGDSVRVALSIFNQGGSPIDYTFDPLPAPQWPEPPPARMIETMPHVLPDSMVRVVSSLRAGMGTSGPQWLRMPRRGDVFEMGIVRDGAIAVIPQLVLGEERASRNVASVTLGIGEATVRVPVRIAYRYADPARGERQRPLAIVPPISLLLDGDVEYAPAATALDRSVRVTVRSSRTTEQRVTVRLTLPTGLQADSASRSVTLPPFGSASVAFRLRGKIAEGRHRLGATASDGSETYTTGYTEIEYEHIRPRQLYRQATIALEAVNVRVPATLRVGYIQGVSDNSASMLAQLGVPLTMLDAERLAQSDLSRFTTIVVGPRAYGASDDLVTNNAVLLEFVRRGGTLVVQYGQQEMTRPGIMPFPVTLAQRADRVTEEDAPVRILNAAPLLTTPNRITAGDFDGWVQERSSYMPRTFDPRYRTVLSMNDPGEPPNDAALLWTPLGRGTYVYTTLAFFRQLPAGNPGAARLFVNLLSAGQPSR